MSKLCNNCGESINNEANFCDKCGANVTKNCSNCGFTLDDEDKFCTNCGHPRINKSVQDSKIIIKNNNDLNCINNDLSNTIQKNTTNNIENKSKIYKLWQGDISLHKTFWLYYCSINFVFYILAQLVFISTDNSIFTMIINIILFLYFVFSAISVLRSARKYNNNLLWKYATYFIVIFAIIVNIYYFII